MVIGIRQLALARALIDCLDLVPESPIPRVIHYFGHLQPLEHPGSLAPLDSTPPAAPPTNPAQPIASFTERSGWQRTGCAPCSSQVPRRRCIANSRQWKRTSLLRPGPSTRNRPYLLRSLLRRLMHRFVPAEFHDPVGLTKRLIRSRDPAAFFAMKLAAAGPFCAPIDFLLESFERRAYQRRRLAGFRSFWCADRLAPGPRCCCRH